MRSLSIGLKDDAYSWVDELAKNSHRSKSEVVRELLEESRETYMKWKAEKVKTGFDALANGEVISNEDVGERLAKRFNIKP